MRPDVERLAKSFNDGRGYDAVRPGYPPDAVAFLTGTTPLRVADIGAGTGKLTEALLAFGHEVIAVEPSAKMLSLLMHKNPTLDVVLGTGERTGLPEDDVDVVCYAQSWHWVKPHEASTEAARILRPGGRLGLVWNLLDDSVDWVARYASALHVEHANPIVSTDDLGVGVEFVAPEAAEFAHVQTLTTSELVELATTRSYYLASDEATRGALLGRVRGVVRDTFGAIDDDTVLELPYRTQCFRFSLLPG